MSLLRWFKPQSKTSIGLPDPKQENSQEEERKIDSADKAVEDALKSSGAKKRGPKATYSPELGAKIGRVAAEIGNKAAVTRVANTKKISFL